MGVDGDVAELLTAELALQYRGRVLLAAGTELLVELLTAIGRGIGLDLDRDALVGRLVGVLHRVLPLSDLLLGQLAGADIGLLDLKHDVGVVGLIDDLLEGVRRDDGRHTRQRGQRLGSQYAIGDLELGEADDTAALLALEAQEELTALHRWLIGDGEVHRAIGANGIAHYALVAEHLLALESSTSAPLLAALVAQHGDDGQLGVLREPLGGEGQVHRDGDLAADSLQRLRLGLDEVCCERAKLRPTARSDE